MNHKRVCIDANPIVGLYVRGYLSGIGRTTYELILAMSKLHNLPIDIMLYSQNMKGIGVDKFPNFKGKHLYFPHRPNYNKWLGRFPIRECLTNYDLLHITHNFEYLYAPERTIITLHDALFMKMQENAFGHDKMIEKVPPLMRKCKAIITCSEHSKKDIIETMQVDPDKIHVIPWGIRHDVFYPIPDKMLVQQKLCEKFSVNRSYFLSVSCNMERKNTPRLIDVYIELLKEGIESDLYLVWNAPHEIRDKISDAGMQDRIHFVSNISDEELGLLYVGATATIFPSLYEGFGLPVLESMACGTPVISSNTSSLPEVGGDVPVYIDPLDNRSIKEAIMFFDGNGFDRKELVKKGIARAEQFSWEECVKQTVSVYQKCLSDI